MDPGEIYSYLKNLGISNHHTVHHRSYSDSALYSLYLLASSTRTDPMLHPYSNDNVEGSLRSSSPASSPRARPNSFPRTPQSFSSSSLSSFISNEDVDDVEVEVEVDDVHGYDYGYGDGDGDGDGDEDDYGDNDEGYYGDEEEKEVDEVVEDDDVGSVSDCALSESIESCMKREWQEFGALLELADRAKEESKNEEDDP